MCAYEVLPANAAGVCGAVARATPHAGCDLEAGCEEQTQEAWAHYWAHCRVVCNLEQPPVSAALTRPLLDVSSSVDVDLRTRVHP
jgi:hypothetical protein